MLLQGLSDTSSLLGYYAHKRNLLFSSQMLPAVYKTLCVWERCELPDIFNVCSAFAMSHFKTTIFTVHPIKHAHGLAVICFVVILLGLVGRTYMYQRSILILQSCVTGTALWHLMRLRNWRIVASHWKQWIGLITHAQIAFLVYSISVNEMSVKCWLFWSACSELNLWFSPVRDCSYLLGSRFSIPSHDCNVRWAGHH